ncbi:MAG TPA: hypothetical protein GX688_02245 [Clostridiales bacterium]|nr:hypothetical protein [Clostridiales bacterium]
MSEPNNSHHEQPDHEGKKPLPPSLAAYLKVKNALKGPDLLRDEDGLAAKRFSRTYIRNTCPFCETTADHEGKKYRYSKYTKQRIILNIVLMLGAAVATGIGLLNIFVGAAVILLLGFSMSKHTDRKMYYSLLCRNCGSHFPMDPEEQEKIRREELEKKQKEAELEAQKAEEAALDQEQDEEAESE